MIEKCLLKIPQVLNLLTRQQIKKEPIFAEKKPSTNNRGINRRVFKQLIINKTTKKKKDEKSFRNRTDNLHEQFYIRRQLKDKENLHERKKGYSDPTS